MGKAVQKPGKAPVTPSGSSRREIKKASRNGSDGLASNIRMLFLGVSILVLFLASWIAVKGTGGRKPSAVVSLASDAAFNKFVGAHQDGALVEFYVPSCSHCQELRPEFDAAALELRNAGAGTPLADVDCTALPGLARRHGVNKYPTILWFRRGEQVLEAGPKTRTKDRIVEYVRWASEPALVEFATAAELDDAVPTLRQTLSSKLPPLIVAFAGPTGMRSLIESAAERLRGKTVFMYVAEAPSDDGAHLRAYAREPSGDLAYEGELEPDEILAWARALVKRGKKTGNATEPPAGPAATEDAASTGAASA